MHLVAELTTRGGIARSAELAHLGFSAKRIRRLLTAGELIRPQRGWVALPTADPWLVFAARHHVVLSCVTQAKRLGLWVKDPPPTPHVATPGRGAKISGVDVVAHWSRPVAPRPAMSLEDPLENALVHVAQCQPLESALTIWESAIVGGRTDLQALGRLPLDARARSVLERCQPFSDSGLETLVFTRLRWLPIPVRQQTMLFGRRVDLLIGQRLVVQIDGATHTGAQRTADITHDAVLMSRGYRVIRLSYAQVMERWEETQALILAAIARGEHRA